MFIAKLTSNDSAKDKALACKAAKNIRDYFEEKSKNYVKINFQQIIITQKPYFQKLNLVRRIEEKAQGLASRKNNNFGSLQNIYQNGVSDSDHEILQQENSDDEYLVSQNDPQNRSNRKKNQNYQATTSDSENSDQDIIMEDLQKDLNVTLDEIVEFYIDPKNLLIKKFNQQWKDQVPEQLQKSRKLFIQELENIHNQIRQFFMQFMNELKNKPALDSQSIFLQKKSIDDFQQLNIKNRINIFDQIEEVKQCQDLKNLFQKAGAGYLISMIQNQWKYDKILEIDGEEIVCNPRISLPQPEDFKIQLNKDIVDALVDILQNEQISRLDLFSNQFLDELKINFKSIDPPTDDEFIGEILQDFKNEFIGCEEHCPLCRRQCDYPHKESEPLAERIHQCLEGHQIQGFGGNKHFGTNKAITKSCSELRDSDEVFYQQNTIKWCTFKQRFQNWKFEGPSQGALSIVKEKNIQIWNFLGQQIYTSGSMEGRKWQDLINAVTNFLKIFDQNLNLKTFSRISIVTYNGCVQKICIKQIPNTNLIDNIKYLGGGTDFRQPLIEAKKIIEDCYKNFDKFVLCFLSDGEASYPENIINEFRASKRIMDKLDFTGIGFGHEQTFQQILGQMAEALNGKLKTTIEPQELSNMFVKLIPNLYEE